jgi:hypothetical protein
MVEHLFNVETNIPNIHAIMACIGYIHRQVKGDIVQNVPINQ